MYPEPGSYAPRRMDPGEQTTGTRDEHYNLISVLYHALHGAENCEIYMVDAEAAGKDELAAFFREAQSTQSRLAERAKGFLGIRSSVTMPGTTETGTEIPPEGMVEPEAPSRTEPSSIRPGTEEARPRPEEPIARTEEAPPSRCHRCRKRFRQKGRERSQRRKRLRLRGRKRSRQAPHRKLPRRTCRGKLRPHRGRKKPRRDRQMLRVGLTSRRTRLTRPPRKYLRCPMCRACRRVRSRSQMKTSSQRRRPLRQTPRQRAKTWGRRRSLREARFCRPTPRAKPHYPVRSGPKGGRRRSLHCAGVGGGPQVQVLR